MANAIYPRYKQALMTAGANVNLLTGNVKAVLVDSADYTYSASHGFLSDIPAAARVATSGNLAGKTVSASGVFDADNLVLSAVSGDPSEAIVIYIDTGVESTSWLVHYIDTVQNGLPITPNGGDIPLNWNASGIFQL